jgi:hypothetical protein
MTYTLSKSPANQPLAKKNIHPQHEDANTTQDIMRHPNRTALTKMHMLHVYNPSPPPLRTEPKPNNSHVWTKTRLYN